MRRQPSDQEFRRDPSASNHSVVLRVCLPGAAGLARRLIAWTVLLFVMAGLQADDVGVGPLAWAEDAAAAKPLMQRKTVKGVTFNLPPDWPIEERDGFTAPIPVEEYLARKFRRLESRLQMLEQRFSGFDLRLRILEQGGVTGGGERLRSSEGPAR